MWPAVKRQFSQEEFKAYFQSLSWGAWRPSRIVWHNTAAPTLKQWMVSAAKDKENGLVPGISRIKSLEDFFRNNNHWSGCPHLFIANDFIWVMNPLTAPGVHSPSWNHISIGIEHIGDFDTEDDNTGEGLKVQENGVFATAVLCAGLGLDPNYAIFLHKQDPKTTHDCPGKHMAVDKLSMIKDVQDLMAGGEHNPHTIMETIQGSPPPAPKEGVVITDGLNFRSGPGVLSDSRGMLHKGTKVTILDSASNSTTAWLKVKTPAGYIGWVAGKYVETKGA